MVKRIKIWIKTIFYFLASYNCVNKSQFFTNEKFVDIVINERKSVIRLGDGEFNLLNKKSISYQKYSKNLSGNLQKLISEYLVNFKKKNYILCMPRPFLECSGYKIMKKREYISSWAFSRYYFKNKYDKNIQYGDAFFFAKTNEEVYKKIWENKDDILFLHNDEKYADIFNKKYNKKVKFIKVPKENCYELKNDLIKKIIKLANKQKSLILISAGPAAKIMVYELANKGYQAIDTGHCWDAPLSIL